MADSKKGKLETFVGKVRWATIPPRDPRGPSSDYTTDTNRDDLTYSIEVQCSESKFKELRRAGIPKLTELRGTGEKGSVTEEDEKNGETYLRLKAPKHKTNAAKPGQPYVYGDILTYNADGTPLTESVGNGSEAVVTAYLRDNPRGGKTLRLHAVKITKLVPFTGGGLSDEEREALGLPEESKEYVDTSTGEVITSNNSDHGYF